MIAAFVLHLEGAGFCWEQGGCAGLGGDAELEPLLASLGARPAALHGELQRDPLLHTPGSQACSFLVRTLPITYPCPPPLLFVFFFSL